MSQLLIRHIKWITNEDILYSTRNSLVMYCGDLNGKEIQKIGDICIHTGFLVAQVVKNPPAMQETPV